jgi:flagella basal body P-ring formation protein FlgA
MKIWLILLALPLAADCIAVVNDRITVGDLARAVAAFAAAPASDVLGYAPAPGVRRSFSAADLRRWARRYEVNEAQLPAGVCFAWPVAALPRTAVIDALRRAVANPDARLELREFSSQPVPAGEIEFPRGGLTVPPRWQPGEPLIWKGRVKYAAGRSFPIWARTVVGIPGKRVVAKRELPVGRVIADDQVALEDYERLPFSAAALDKIEQVVGRVPRRSIEAGRTVAAALLGEPMVVEKGDRVAVEVRTGSMKLSMDTVSESGGRTGETVVLRNLSSGKRFPARIEGKGRAVSLSPAS